MDSESSENSSLILPSPVIINPVSYTEHRYLDAVPGNKIGEISVLNWNIAKGAMHGWQTDLRHLSANKDIVIIQEAALEASLYDAFSEERHWSFSSGFLRRHQQTGVLTISRAAPLSSHKFRQKEPLLRTPKATLITEYPLYNNQTLLVANIHAINFTIGTRIFTAQLDRIYRILKLHEGPILFCGDFNTWQQRRVKRLQELISALSLQAINFDHDRRKHTFGLPLDHMFYRGMISKEAHALAVTSSDHNPMSVTFETLNKN